VRRVSLPEALLLLPPFSPPLGPPQAWVRPRVLSPDLSPAKHSPGPRPKGQSLGSSHCQLSDPRSPCSIPPLPAPTALSGLWPDWMFAPHAWPQAKGSIPGVQPLPTFRPSFSLLHLSLPLRPSLGFGQTGCLLPTPELFQTPPKAQTIRPTPGAPGLPTPRAPSSPHGRSVSAGLFWPEGLPPGLSVAGRAIPTPGPYQTLTEAQTI
jgi:hypothetical protein